MKAFEKHCTISNPSEAVKDTAGAVLDLIKEKSLTHHEALEVLECVKALMQDQPV